MDDVHKSHVEVADVRQQLMIADVVGWVELLYRDDQSAIRDASNLCDGVVSQDVAEGPTWTQMPEVVAQIEDRGETKFVLSSAATQAQQARGMQPDHDEASIQPNEAQPEALEREAEHMMDQRARERNDVHVAATAVTGAMSAEVKEMKAEIDLLKAEVLELRKDAAISSEMLQQAETRAKVGVSCQALLTSLHMIRGLWHALTLPSTHACTRRSRRRWRPPMRQV